MHGAPNRMGLGLRAPMPNYQQPMPHPQSPQSAPGPMLKATTLFVGSISPGISDSFLTSLFAVCFILILDIESEADFIWVCVNWECDGYMLVV